jgi:hypothetical protein
MIEIKIGDCTERLKDLEDNSVDAVISDPPYGLKFMSKGWDDIGDGSQQREWHRKWLTEAYRVLKPNGVVKAFSGSRTFHHLIAMMEEIGFGDLQVEAWAYGSGFPKSLAVAKSIEGKLTVGNSRYSGKKMETDGDVPAVGSLWVDSANRTMSEGKDAWSGKSVKVNNKKAKQWEGWGTALKPSWEPICIGVKK